MKAIEHQIEIETQQVVNKNKEESKSLSEKRQSEMIEMEKQYKK